MVSRAAAYEPALSQRVHLDGCRLYPALFHFEVFELLLQ